MSEKFIHFMSFSLQARSLLARCVYGVLTMIAAHCILTWVNHWKINKLGHNLLIFGLQATRGSYPPGRLAQVNKSGSREILGPGSDRGSQRGGRIASTDLMGTSGAAANLGPLEGKWENFELWGRNVVSECDSFCFDIGRLLLNNDDFWQATDEKYSFHESTLSHWYLFAHIFVSYPKYICISFQRVRESSNVSAIHNELKVKTVFNQDWSLIQVMILDPRFMNSIVNLYLESEYRFFPQLYYFVTIIHLNLKNTR